MDRRMLINSLHPEECRIAIVEDGRLNELEVESLVGKKLKGNIYKARISRIEPSLQAAFVDLGTDRNGFLQINDIHPSFFRRKGRTSRGNIQDVLSPGQELVVQVVKEERDQKGATLTTYLSLPGRYVVLMPGSDKGGVSRKISDSEQRLRLRNLAKELELPSGIGIIVRTAGLDRSQSELARDLSLQLRLWEKIVMAAQTASCPQMLFQENDLATRVIRDYFTPDVREIIIDEPNTFNRVKEFIGLVMPRYRSRVKFYQDPTPIFSYYSIEEQVAETMSREVKLPSGGSIVIDSLEALVAIDINSGKSTSGDSIENTAYKTNIEAADEIARQLRLRDLGGLIVIDFIDMNDSRHRAAVEKQIRQAVKLDKARIEIGSLSRFGLLEMSRQRIRASIASQSSIKCSHCEGTGHVRAPETVALDALRKIQTAIVGGKAHLVRARLSPSPAIFLLNNKRNEISALESTYQAKILIIPDGRLRAAEHEFEISLGQESETTSSASSSRRIFSGPNGDSGAKTKNDASRSATATRSKRGPRTRGLRKRLSARKTSDSLPRHDSAAAAGSNIESRGEAPKKIDADPLTPPPEKKAKTENELPRVATDKVPKKQIIPSDLD